jgi:hypothetical protein
MEQIAWLLVLLIPGAWLLMAFLLAFLVNQPRGPQQWGTGMTAELRYGPVLAAVVLALAALPVVAVSMSLFDPTQPIWSDTIKPLPFNDMRRWSSAMSGVLAASLLAAAIGTWAVRTHVIAGSLFTFLIALTVGITALPLLPALLGQRVGAELFCIDGCNPIVSSEDPTTGLRAVIVFGWAPFVEPVVVAVLAVGVALWAWVVRTFFMPTREGYPGHSSAEAA